MSRGDGRGEDLEEWEEEWRRRHGELRTATGGGDMTEEVGGRWQGVIDQDFGAGRR